MKSCYQLIKSITKFENYKTRHQFYVFMKKKTSLLGKMWDKSVCTWHVLLLTLLWHVNCPFNHAITLSNYNHDTDIVLSVLKS